MRKIFGLLLCITTLVLGYVAATAYEMERLPKSTDVVVATDKPILTRACQLMIEDNDVLVGQTISFRATVYALNTGELMANTLDGEGCTDDEYAKFRWSRRPARLEVDANDQMTELRDYLQKNKLDVDLQIIGPAEIRLVEGKYKIYLVNPTEVRRLSPFRPATPKGAA